MRWLNWLVAIGLAGIGFAYFAPSAAQVVYGIFPSAGPHLASALALFGMLALAAAALVAGRGGVLIVLAVAGATAWSMLHPSAVVHAMAAGRALTAPLLDVQPLAKLATEIPGLDPLWLLLLGLVAFLVTSSLALAPRVE